MKRIKTLLQLMMVLALPGTFLVPSGAGEPTEKPAKGPNLLVDVSAAVVNGAVQRAVDRTEPVEMVIQETPASGMSRTQGNVWAELIPDPYQAAVDIVLNGRVYSRSVGTRPRVLLYTACVTPVEARRRVLINGGGIRELPGLTCAKSMIELLEVTSHNGERDTTATDFARMGFKRNREAAEAETAGKTAWRVSNRLGEDLSPALASASQFVGGGLKRIKQAGLSLDGPEFSTTTAFLQARLRIGNAGDGQPGPSPSLPADIDLGMRVHQSVINKTAQAVLRGKAFTLSEANKFYEEATLGLLLDGRKDDDKRMSLKTLEKLLAAIPGKPAAIVLAQKDPLTMAFTDQGFTVEIHIASIRQNGVVYAGMRVRAAYRLENSKDGVRAVRKGPVRFLPAEEVSGDDKKVAQPATFLVVREILFAEVMKERLILAPLPLPDSLTSVRFLAPRSDARDGWLVVTWKLASRPRPS